MTTLIRLEEVAGGIVSSYARQALASIGQNLKSIRGGRDQKEIAARMQVQQARLSNWENDRYDTVNVDTLLWLAKGYNCSVEEIVQGVDAEYDAMRDLIRHGGTGELPVPPLEGEPDVPASARERIAALERLVADYETRLAETQDVARRLAHIAADRRKVGGKDQSPSGSEPGDGERDR